MTELINVKDLQSFFFVDEGIIKAADKVNLSINKGEIVGIVGESGSGKSVSALSIMKLIRPPGKIVSGQIWLGNENLVNKEIKEMRKIRGKRISMIFQDPMTSLNPRLKIGDQISELIKLHSLESEKDSLFHRLLASRKKNKIARQIAVENMKKVGIPDADKRYDSYPHEFSGGMRQRVMIAMALSAQPDLLIADEPTTALDVTVQAQILQLLRELSRELGMSVLLITHDLSVISEICDRVYVMYAGSVCEDATVQDLFERPLHPYTQALLKCIPRVDSDEQNIQPIKGEMPDLTSLPDGCRFAPRCPYKFDPCDHQLPELYAVSGDHRVRCYLYADEALNDQILPQNNL